jgi:hypothetical protein
MKHTPEPWKVFYHEDEFAEVVADSNDFPIVLGGPNICIKVSDAARIVACVNACKGLTNKELETLQAFKHVISYSVFHYNSILPDVQIWLQTGRHKEYMMRYNLDMYLALQGIANTLSDKVSLRIDDHNGFAYFKRK